MPTAPVSHLQEAQKLTADAACDLYRLYIPSLAIYFHFWDGPEVEWQGDTYEFLPCQMTGDRMSADGQESRPTLRWANPEGMFNEHAFTGKLDKAIVTRRRVLKAHLDADTNIYQQRIWYVGRVREVIAGQSVAVELRNMTDGPSFQIPVRRFIPPAFPVVQL